MSSAITRRTVAIAAAFALAAAGALVSSERVNAGGIGAARALLHDQAGNSVGVVHFIKQGDTVLVKADLAAAIGTFPAGIPAGFKGFHIHAGAACEGNFVASAGGHFGHDSAAPATTPHGTHEGDMPVVLVNPDGTAVARFVTDRITVEEIIGRVVVMHEGPDNYANVGRYGTADAATLGTGDAGRRYACGVIA